jgi:hypothetical protein
LGGDTLNHEEGEQAGDRDQGTARAVLPTIAKLT